MEDVLFQEVDVADEQDAWTRISESMMVLESYYDEISRTGGIDRTTARALVEQCGVMMSERYPLQSFTEVASRTNYAVALESVVERSAKLVFELLKQAAELLLKVVRWVIDLIRNRRDRNRRTAAKTQSIAAVDQANRELKGAGVEDVKPQGDDAKATVAAQNAVAAAVEIYEQNFNDLVADILTSGEFSRLVREISNTVFEVAPVIRNKLVLFDKILRTHVKPGDNTGNMIELAELRTIAKPVPVDNIVMLLKRGGQRVESAADGQPRLSESMRVLMDAYQQKRMGSEFDPVNIQVVADYLSATDSKVIAPFMLAPDETAKTMEEIGRELQRIRNLEPSHAAPPENRQAFQNAVVVLTDEVNALRLLVSVIEGCSLTQDRLVDDIWRYETAQFQYYRAMAGVSNNSSIVDEVNRIQSELRHTLNRFGT